MGKRFSFFSKFWCLKIYIICASYKINTVGREYCYSPIFERTLFILINVKYLDIVGFYLFWKMCSVSQLYIKNHLSLHYSGHFCLYLVLENIFIVRYNIDKIVCNVLSLVHTYKNKQNCNMLYDVSSAWFIEKICNIWWISFAINVTEY